MKSIKKDFAVVYKDENKVTSLNNKKGDISLTTSDITGINNLVITGSTILNTVTMTNNDISGTLNVTGTSTQSTVNLTTGNVSGALNVTGTSTQSTVNMTTGNVSGELNVTGTSTQSTVNMTTGNVSGELNVTGTTTIKGITYPVIDGSDGQVLTTNGSGTLTFNSVSAGNNPVTLNLNNSNSTINLSLYKTTSFRIKNPAQISLSNGTNGVWYTLAIVSDGNYSFTSEVRFPLNNAQPVPSSGTIDMYSLHCIDTVSGTRYLATFAYDYSGVILP